MDTSRSWAHCTGRQRMFRSVTAFDLHLQGLEPVVCVDPSTVPKLKRQDDCTWSRTAARRPRTWGCAVTVPATCRLPTGALAWLEGSGWRPSRGLYDEDHTATLRWVLDAREVDERRVVPGITGHVNAAEFMVLAGRVDALERRGS